MHCSWQSFLPRVQLLLVKTLLFLSPLFPSFFLFSLFLILSPFIAICTRIDLSAGTGCLFVIVKLAAVDQTFSRIFLFFHLRFESEPDRPRYRKLKQLARAARCDNFSNWKRK